MQETKRRSVKTEYDYQDAFDSNAARDLNLMPEKSPEELPAKRDNVVKLTDKQLRKARMQGINPLRSVLSVVSVVLVFLQYTLSQILLRVIVVQKVYVLQLLQSALVSNVTAVGLQYLLSFTVLQAVLAVKHRYGNIYSPI